ncbi:ABC transporter permease [Vibrio casei]|uniref:Thiamine ABC transporter permease n=1 Tax=Vibrio casei TaxID=673372 RepID=A0A368LNJ1_9VIBR|nr:thiamine ABC transporter permease [Vibrio casei]RCS73385.1 thiamine ABC transporter permease [Vibrio casei]SJN17393.1 ABC transporter, permease protein YnjC [Vibrio casei]
MLRLSYLIVLLIGVFPLIPGFFGMIAPALGYIPPLGLFNISLDAFYSVFSWPGVLHSIKQTLFIAISSSLLASIMTFSIIQAYWGTRHWVRVEKSLSPLLALPHVAFAVGFLFLFSDTGWIARLIHLVFSHTLFDGFFSLQDTVGIGLTFALAIKETPFLLLMSMPILHNLKVPETLQVSQSLGYSLHQSWWKILFPQWWKHMRFPLFAIIAYSGSVVDVSLILGPTHPPTFSVLVWQWFNEPDLSQLPRAAAGAFVLFFLCSLLIALIWMLERTFLGFYRSWMLSGRHSHIVIKPYFFLLLAAISLATLPIIIIWTFAQRWQFPNMLPTNWSLRFWQSEWFYIQETIITSISIALFSSFIALVLAIIAHEYRHKFSIALPMYIIALPILIPQLSLLFGMQITSLWVGQDHYLTWVVWSHVFFAFPYIYLSLDGPWKSYPIRLSQTATSLGLSPIMTWFKIKVRTLSGAILFAWAMGISVSLALYLPTIMLGAGRITTLTTEAVALSSGHDRRVVALYALWQAILPFVFFSVALFTNRLLQRRTNLTPLGIK